MKKMMAVLLVLVLAASLAACAQATETIYVQTESVRTIGQNVIRMEYEYSDDGTPISIKTYFNDKLYQTTSSRTSGGIQYLTITDADGNSSTQATENKYDADGKLLQVSTSIGGTEAAYTNYSYDDNGRLASTVSVTASAVINTTYTYDDNDNLLSALEENQNSGDYLRKDYEYDADGDVIKQSTYTAEDTLEEYVTVSYNADKSEKTFTYYKGDGTASGEVVVETYDEYGNNIKSVTTFDGEVAMTIESTFVALEVPVKE